MNCNATQLFLLLASSQFAQVLFAASPYPGLDTAHHPHWGTLAEKRPVFEDPNGVGWCMSASYNSFFDRVLLCTEHGNSRQGAIGIFDAPTPWGPWTTVKYFDKSSPFGVVRKGSKLPWNNNVFLWHLQPSGLIATLSS